MAAKFLRVWWSSASSFLEAGTEWSKKSTVLSGFVSISSASFSSYPVTIASDSGISGLGSASISLDPDYLASESYQRLAFIGLTVSGSAAAIATSGDYRRYVTIKGQTYSHIINTTTATAAHGLASVTVIADNTAKADALATAVTALGKEKGVTLIESLDNTEAILISAAPEYRLQFTSGANAHMMQE